MPHNLLTCHREEFSQLKFPLPDDSSYCQFDQKTNTIDLLLTRPNKGPRQQRTITLHMDYKSMWEPNLSLLSNGQSSYVRKITSFRNRIWSYSSIIDYTLSMMMFGKISRQLCSLKKIPWSCDSRSFWEWLNTVFNKVDYERIKDVGPDRAASEWLLRCGAKVRFCGHQKWLQDYNKLPGGSVDRYKIQAIDATDSCIMDIGLDHMVGLEHVEKITLCKCHYIEDNSLQRLSQLENLRKSLLELEIIACGNVTDNGIIALRHFRNLKYLFLSDLPGVKDKEYLAQVFKTALPSVELKLNLK